MKIYYFYIGGKIRTPEMDVCGEYVKLAEKGECYYYPEYSDFYYHKHIDNLKKDKNFYKDLDIKLLNPKSKEKDVIDKGINSYMIFSEKLKKILEELKIPFEFYPVKCRGKTYYLVGEDNIPVIDCVNLEKSDLKYFKSDGSLRGINKYVFNESIIGKNLVFKIPNFNNSRLFCTEEFLNILIENKITGLIFHNTEEDSYFWDNNIYI